MNQSRSRKSARRPRCIPTSHGSERLDLRQSSQIVQQYADPDATYRASISHFTVAQLLHSLDRN